MVLCFADSMWCTRNERGKKFILNVFSCNHQLWSIDTNTQTIDTTSVHKTFLNETTCVCVVLMSNASHAFNIKRRWYIESNYICWYHVGVINHWHVSDTGHAFGLKCQCCIDNQCYLIVILLWYWFDMIT
jgi:hypothetical protein